MKSIQHCIVDVVLAFLLLAATTVTKSNAFSCSTSASSSSTASPASSSTTMMMILRHAIPPSTHDRKLGSSGFGCRSSSMARCAVEDDQDAEASTQDDPSATTIMSQIRFLGRGANAIVRPGVVLLAPQDEYDHFLRRSAVFIYAMGLDEHDVYVIRGVLLDHPTPFTVKEMIEQGYGSAAANDDDDNENDKANDGIMDNLVFRGGRLGNEASISMFHCDLVLAKECEASMIGSTGIYEGGFSFLFNDNKAINPKIQDDGSKFKFFFNYVEFTEQELENMLGDVQSDGDAWTSLEVPPEIVLDSTYDRGNAWSRLRNHVRELP